jgi:type IV secretory pathway ATPase VirB11/archaellum biosynthesis ATPase
MGKRGTANQTKHDKKVRSLANSYRRKGFKVKADLMGFEKPTPIGKNKRIPDIEATKPGTRHIVEVETKDTYDSDKSQRASFRKSARKRRRTKYLENVV